MEMNLIRAALFIVLVSLGSAAAADGEARVYAEILNGYVQGLGKDKSLRIVVSSTSISMAPAYQLMNMSPPKPLEEDITWRVPEAKEETVRDFVRKADVPRVVDVAPGVLDRQIKIELVSREKMAATLSGGHIEAWRRFSERHPDARYYVEFGPIGFDSSANEALVYVHRTCPGLCGGGELVLLRQSGGVWRVHRFHQFWIS